MCFLYLFSMKKEISAGIIVYIREKNKIEYLLLHYEEGHWDFPKGHVENSEKIESTAKRETKEETGLMVKPNIKFRKLITYSFVSNQNKIVNKKAYFFIGEAKSKKVKLSSEHIDYEWLDYENALQRLTYNNVKDLLKKADEFLAKAQRLSTSTVTN